MVTRTTDRDFWTFSLPSNSTGRYVSFFSASDEQGSDPVQLNVQVAVGQRSYSAGLANVDFKRLSSATMDVKLPASGLGLPLPKSSPEAGAVYRGLLVGVLGRNGVIKPLSVRWPDTQGRFSLVLAASRPGDDPAFLGERLRDVLHRRRPAGRTGGPGRDATAPDAAYSERDRGRARLGLIRQASFCLQRLPDGSRRPFFPLGHLLGRR